MCPKTVNKTPAVIWDWVWSVVYGVSDETGIELNGGFLLAYEGWSCSCVEGVWDENKTDEENEEACFDYAEDQANEVFEEWKKKYKRRYDLIDWGHERKNLYGVTWALFELKPGCSHGKTRAL